VRLPWRFLSTLVVVGLILWTTRGLRDDSHEAELPPLENAKPALSPMESAATADPAATVTLPATAEVSSADEEKTTSEPVIARAGAPDADEWAELRDELQTVEDRSTSNHMIEMPAYYRLLSWAESQEASSLLAQAKQETFHDLVHHPAKYRGELLRVNLRVRRALRYELPSNNPLHDRAVYELWGWPRDSRGWLYVVLTPELPAGIPLGDQIDVDVQAVGYFFKLQGYQPAQAKPGATPLVAPLLIGRVIPERHTPLAVSKNERWALVLLGVAAVVAVFAACLGSMAAFKGLRRKPRTTLAHETPLPDSEFVFPTDSAAADDDEPESGRGRDDDWWLNPNDRNAPPYADR